MEKHVFKEILFINDGVLDGMRTCLMLWRCKTCQTELLIPCGANPKDYSETICVVPEKKIEVKRKWCSPNKKDYPRKKGDRHVTATVC